MSSGQKDQRFSAHLNPTTHQVPCVSSISYGILQPRTSWTRFSPSLMQGRTSAVGDDPLQPDLVALVIFFLVPRAPERLSNTGIFQALVCGGIRKLHEAGRDLAVGNRLICTYWRRHVSELCDLDIQAVPRMFVVTLDSLLSAALLS